MATITEVKAGLDEIAQRIRGERKALKNAKAQITTSKGVLNLIPTAFQDILSTINAYAPTGEFESLAKDELAKMTIEFITLVTDADIAVIDLVDRTEF